MDFIKNLSLHDRAHNDDDDALKPQSKAEEQPLPVRPAPVPESSSFLDKVRPHHSESHDEGPASIPAPPPVVAQSAPEPHHEEKGLLDKIGDAFGRHHNQAADGDQPNVTSESSKDKASDVASRVPPNSHPSPVTSSTQPQHESIMDKFFGGNDENKETKPQQSGGFMDTINGHLGGGAKGEAAEGKIDKVVDFVQEHVFGQGDQSNESAVEQMKDKQIANAIRSGWGGEEKKE